MDDDLVAVIVKRKLADCAKSEIIGVDDQPLVLQVEQHNAQQDKGQYPILEIFFYRLFHSC